MTAATPAAGQENTDGSCYSCCRTGKHRWQLLFLLPDRKTQMTAATPVADRTQLTAAIPAAGQENTDNSCYAVGQENTR